MKLHCMVMIISAYVRTIQEVFERRPNFFQPDTPTDYDLHQQGKVDKTMLWPTQETGLTTSPHPSRPHIITT